jgi:hypothetical protein
MPRKIRPAPSSPAQRSAISNSPHRLPNVDMRSAAGRRFRDLVDAVIAEFGDSNPEGIRELAGLRFTREQVQGDVVTGAKPRAAEDLVRIGRLITRLEATMRETRAVQMARAKVSPLARHFATPLRAAE